MMMMSTMGDDLPFLGIKVKRLKINKIIKLSFQLVFSTYLPKVLLKFQVAIYAKFDSPSKKYPCCILSMDPTIRKMRNT